MVYLQGLETSRWDVKEDGASSAFPCLPKWIASKFKNLHRELTMSNESSEITDQVNEVELWCPSCEAHRKSSIKSGKAVCATCGEAGIFRPLFRKFSFIGLAVLSIFFLFGATAWGPMSFLLSLVCGWFTWKFFSQHQQWVKWAKRAHDRKRRKRRKLSKKKRRKEAEKATPLKPPPVPEPPPLPPDADDED